MSRFQRILATLHLWLGLTLGALFVLIGVTGSLVVFQGELDRLLNPGLLSTASPSEASVAAGEAVATARTRADDGELVSYLSLPGGPGDVFRAYVGSPDDIFARMVTVDPGSGAVLGERPVGESLMRFIHVLHFRLQLGSSGQTLVGITGLFLLLSLVSGIILWWRRGQVWRPLSPRRPWRLHHSIGVYAALPLVVVLVAGVLLALPQYTRPTVNWFSPLSGLDLGRESADAARQEDMGVDTAVARAMEAMPGGEVTSIGLPRKPAGSYRISLREARPEGLRARSGHVVLDRYSGNVLARQHWSERSSGDGFMAWLRPLHGGSALGLPGRILAAGLGLVPLFLFVTGVWLWLKGKRLHRKTERGREI